MHKARRSALALAALAAAVLVAFAASAFSPTDSSDVGRGRGEPAAEGVQAPHEQTASPLRSHIVKSSDPISKTKATPSVARYPTGPANDETGGTGAAPVKPCDLVSRGSAGAILGGAVEVSEGRQGPTCIYRVRGSERELTLVVESTSLTSLRRHARRASRVQPAGHPGWCLRYESTSVAVPLAGGRVLHVTGPCVTAARFAAEALPRLSR
jgi:hypothetical protein